MSQVVLGIDGGGTKTTCVVLDTETREVVGRSVGSSSNRNSVGLPKALEALRSTASGALTSAGKVWADISSICAAVSGVDSQLQEQDLSRELRKWVGPQTLVQVHNDAAAALASGTGGVLQGCVLIAGTGTIAYGFTEDGAQARASGWGANFLDGGSGYDLGQQALAAVARHLDGRGPTTSLTKAICDHYMVDADGILGWAYAETGWSRVAQLAPLVMQCSAAGDAVAMRIIDQSIQELAGSVRAVASRCRFKENFPLVLQGGLLQEGLPYVDGLKSALANLNPRPLCIHPQVEAAVGAGLLALSMLIQQTGLI